MRSLGGAVVLALSLGACAAYQPPVPGGWATYSDMRVHYRQHAWEWDGRCRAPYMDGIVDSEVVRESGQELELLTTYYWRDRVGDETGNDEFPVGGTDRCKGIEERTFVLTKQDDGTLRTVAMDGLRRGGEVPALFH